MVAHNHKMFFFNFFLETLKLKRLLINKSKYHVLTIAYIHQIQITAYIKNILKYCQQFTQHLDTEIRRKSVRFISFKNNEHSRDKTLKMFQD